MSETPYIRVGTSYFKTVKAPTIAGHFNEILVSWNAETIRQDHGKDHIADIPKYDGFTCIPSHTNFKKQHLNFYNMYNMLSNSPKAGECEVSKEFVKHIFGEHYELGLDYLALLFLKPTQILPILCLVSTKRSTGKSTFLKWLKQIFENNATYLTNDSFGSQFNADWANMLLIMIDEVLFNKEELTERIKYLSTTNINKVEAKGKDKREIEFFGKFILCSNNENSFIKIDSNETRFWVLKIPTFKNEEIDMLVKLKKEIPAFLFFLQHRNLSTKNNTRMWFTPNQIKTPALRKLMQNNRNRIEKEIASICLMVMEKFDLEEVNLCSGDILPALSKSRVNSDQTHIRQILKKEWKLSNKENSNSYEKFCFLSDGEIIMTSSKGRYFTIKKGFLLENFDDLMTNYD
ncbi:primase-helicase family protein [Cellulophaga baltica]|uniref:primase-helicase family protein n=1 Tax=Cellulophaga baltica TaxID=76594 RepID=UPI0037CAABB1